jgi:hypothetical protein
MCYVCSSVYVCVYIYVHIYIFLPLQPPWWCILRIWTAPARIPNAAVIGKFRFFHVLSLYVALYTCKCILVPRFA